MKRFIPKNILRRIKQTPWLYKLCVFAYITLQKWRTKARLSVVREHVRNYIRKRPYLMPYAKHVAALTRGGSPVRCISALAQQAIQDTRSWHSSKRTKAAMEQLYRKAIACCVKHRVPGWWNILPDASLHSIANFQILLKDYVLRRAGDYEAYLELEKELHAATGNSSISEPFFPQLIRYFRNSIQSINGSNLRNQLNLNSEKRVFLIAVSVWGEAYLNTFLKYCLPALATEGNCGILGTQRQCVLLIHTNAEGKSRILSDSITKKLQTMGVILHFRMLDDDLLAQIRKDPDYKYWHLGMVQSLDLYYAQALEADYNLLMPDTVYSKDYFKNVLALAAQGHQAITKIGYRTRMQTVCPALDALRMHDGSIALSAGDLAAVGIQNLHTDASVLFMTGRNIQTELPSVHVLAWEGKNTLHFISPHQTILYFDHKIMRDLPKRFFMTLDSELDKIVPKHIPVYCTKPQDEIQYIEISHDTMQASINGNAPLKEFCRIFWSNADNEGYWRFFDTDIVDTLNREMAPNRSYMEEKDIEQAKQSVRRALRENQPKTSHQKSDIAVTVLKMLKTHSQGSSISKQIDEDIKILEPNTASHLESSHA